MINASLRLPFGDTAIVIAWHSAPVRNTAVLRLQKRRCDSARGLSSITVLAAWQSRKLTTKREPLYGGPWGNERRDNPYNHAGRHDTLH